MSQILPLKEVREQLSDLVSKVAYADKKIIITKFGKPVAALVTFEDYERLMDPSKGFSQEEWNKGFALMDKARAQTKNYPKDKVKKAINQAIKEVRQSKRV